MKKLFAILMTLCLLCAACAATADMEIPDWNSMPNLVDNEDNAIEESAFAGEWVLDVAFADQTYITEQELAGTYHYNFMPFIIGDGLVKQDMQNENGEFVTLELPYVFEYGQIHGTDDQGTQFVFELLENGNLVMSVFFPGEGEKVTCLSVFLKHPEEV